MPRVKHDELRELAKGILEAVGSPPATATIVSDSLVDTSLAGKDTHGIRLIERYFKSVQAGKVDPRAEPSLVVDEGPMGVVDGRKGFGQLAANAGVDAAIDKARRHGVGVVGVRNGYHIGRVGQYALRGAHQGLVVMAFANASAQVAPYGSSERVFGTNPFCCAAPRADGDPVVVDAASSLGTVGDVQLAQSLGKVLPDGILLDATGQDTNDPNQFGAGALLPIGRHKGSALSLMVEMLAGVLTGRGNACITPGFAGNGVLFIAIDPSRFQDQFPADLEALCDRVSGARVADGMDRVRLPGEPEREQEASRRAAGVPIDPDTWAFLQEQASTYGLDVPAVTKNLPMILFANDVAPALREQYVAALSDCCELVFPGRHGSHHPVEALAGNAEALVGYRFPRPLLKAARSLRLVQVTGAGVDELDLDDLTARGVTVANSHANARMVAEHAVAMLLTVCKKTAVHDRIMRSGVNARNRSHEPAYASSQLSGSTVGILGLGHVGSALARMLRGFDVRILAYGRSTRTDPEYTQDLDAVLQAADFLFVCLPLTPETDGLIASRQLGLMKKDACLINVSRGRIVVEADLYEALSNRDIHAAAIDVWGEGNEVRTLTGKKQYPSRYPFHKLDNALLSPHRAALRGTAPDDVIENLRRFASGQPLENVVDPARGY